MLPKTKRSPARAEFLADVLTTAVEGGINHWAQVTDYCWYDPRLGAGGSCIYNSDEPNAYVTVHEVGTELEPGRVVTVGVDQIAVAMKRIGAGEFDYLRPDLVHAIKVNNITNGEGDGKVPDVDATLADIIMQVAALGEVIY